VHGSPHQRRVDPGDTRAAALRRAQESFAAIAEHAREGGVVYCIEPLSADQTPLIHTLEEAAKLVQRDRQPRGAQHARLQRRGPHGEPRRSPRSSTAGCRRA
jgi:sugar phosphate isomerase/epimerase